MRKADEGSYTNYADRRFLWAINDLDENNAEALLEIATSSDPDSIYPVEIGFSEGYSVLGFEVVEAVNLADGQKVSCKLSQSVSSDSFIIDS